MRSDTSFCEDVRRELSARLDNEQDERLARPVDEHLRGCPHCRSFERSLADVRRQLRVQPAQSPPDLTAVIMDKLRIDRDVGSLRPYLKTALVAAAVAALVVGGTTLRFGRDRTDVATADEVVKEIRTAARHLDSYRATFEVAENGPARNSTVTITYRAPEMLRIDKVERSDRNGSPTSESSYIVNPDESFERRTLTCARSAPGCSPRAVTRKTIARQPLGGVAPSVTDIVLPMETLAASDAIRVVGTGEPLLGRPTLRVRMPNWQAHVLVDAVRPDSTRSFDPEASVELWLDRENWFPLRFAVTQPGGSTPSLKATATEVSEDAISEEVFETPRRAAQVVNERFRSGPPPSVTPTFTAGLESYRSGKTAEGHSLATYTNGLAWMTLKVADDTLPPESLISAEVVPLPDIGPVYYSPGGDRQSRVVDIYDGTQHLRLESNLPRATLLEVANSLPVQGKAVDRIGRGALLVERATPDAVYEIGLLQPPGGLPPGYRPVSATVTRRGRDVLDMVVRYSQPQNDFTDGIVVTAVPRTRALPASSETFTTYRVGDSAARWSALRGELEWVEGKVYRAVRVGDFRVDMALRIARSMS